MSSDKPGPPEESFDQDPRTDSEISDQETPATEPEPWLRIREIVADALDLPASERAAFAEQECGEDDALLKRVQTYLDRDDTTFMQEPIFSLRKKASRTDDFRSWIGRLAGPYLLKDILGVGGFGVVFLAEHIGGDHGGDVALKILRSSTMTTAWVRRLQDERRILGSLLHPFIARFLDGGRTENGLPYIVMERVDGRPIHEYCRNKSLSVLETLELFLSVCSAVRFAHGRAIIHCDIKPDNILVTEEGLPRLLDFGIARYAGRRGPSEAQSAFSMTPLYAAPEQFRSQEPTVAVDVYALGLLLYELLTGRKAHRPQDDDLESIERAVRKDMPPKPSLALDPSTETNEGDVRRKLVAGDLDSIVMKALSKDPEDRYDSVADLAEDLRRHLEGFPVLARPGEPFYAAGKFLRRHRAWVLIAGLLLGFTGWTWSQSLYIEKQNVELQANYQQLEIQKSEIEIERDRATEVREFLVGFLRSSDPRRSAETDLTVKEALKAAAAELRDSLGDKPEVRAELLDTIGRIFTNLGVHDDADRILSEALEIRRDLLGGDHFQVAESLHNWAYLKRRIGRSDRALALRRQAVLIQRNAFPEGHQDLARGLHAVASLLRQNGSLDEAETLAEEALAMQTTLLGDRHLDVAGTLNTLAAIHRSRGELQEAERRFRLSLDIRRDHVSPMDSGIAVGLNNLALAQLDLGRTESAVEMLRQAQTIRDELYPAVHGSRRTNLSNLAIALAMNGEGEEALPLIDEAIEIHGRLTKGATHPALQLNRASVVESHKTKNGCLEAADSVLEMLGSGGSSKRMADAGSIRGGCLTHLSRFEEAMPLLSENYQMLREILGDCPRQTRQARGRLIYFYEKQGLGDQARALAEMPINCD